MNCTLNHWVSIPLLLSSGQYLPVYVSTIISKLDSIMKYVRLKLFFRVCDLGRGFISINPSRILSWFFFPGIWSPKSFCSYLLSSFLGLFLVSVLMLTIDPDTTDPESICGHLAFLTHSLFRPFRPVFLSLYSVRFSSLNLLKFSEKYEWIDLSGWLYEEMCSPRVLFYWSGIVLSLLFDCSEGVWVSRFFWVRLNFWVYSKSVSAS